MAIGSCVSSGGGESTSRPRFVQSAGEPPDPGGPGDEGPAASATLGPNARYVVELGVMRNRSGVRGDDLGRVLHDAARSYARALLGAVVVERGTALSARGSGRDLPVVTLDGLVTHVTEQRPAGSVQVLARVEFSIRRRQQNLEATLTGAATSFGTSPTVSEESRRRLEDQAVEGAVQSALGGAAAGLIAPPRP